MDFDFSGQDQISSPPSSDGLLSSSLLDLNKDEKKKSIEQGGFDLSGQEDLFPKERSILNKPKGLDKVSGGKKFGNRVDPFTGKIAFHNGDDIPMQLNTPINSWGRGTVVKVKNEGKKNYGKSVIVDYGGGLELEFGHLNQINVEEGDRLSPEAIVGLSGSTGRSKAPHLHVKATLSGKPIDPKSLFSQHEMAIGSLSNEDVVSDKQFDFSGQEDIKVSEQSVDSSGFDFSSQDQIGEIQGLKPLEEKPFVTDPTTLEERVAIGAGQKFGSKPIITVKNPDQLVGNKITTIVQTKDIRKPDINTLTDYWLGAIDPSYSRINQEYRSQSGQNLIRFDIPPDRQIKDLGNKNWQFTARLTKGSVELINAYINGRNKGGPEAGWEAAYLKSQEIKRDQRKVSEEIRDYKANEAENYAKKHPYLNSIIDVLNSAAPSLNLKTEDIGSGLHGYLEGNAQLVHNLRTLPYAVYMLERYGGDSKEYQDALEKDEEISRNLYLEQANVFSPEDFKGQVTKGVVEGVGFLPKAWAVAPLGSAGLPLLVYIENIHRGNRYAVKAALPMALMAGGTHGLSDFLTSGSKVYTHYQLKDGSWTTGYVEVGRGLGTRAPFVKIPKELSIKSEVQEAFLSGEPVSIGAITPLQRQLLMRGTNALLTGVPTALEGGDITQTASSLAIGLTFPIGRYKTGSFSEGKLTEKPPVDSPSSDYLKLIEQGRVSVPTSPTPTYGKTSILSSERNIPPVIYPSSESPNVGKYGEKFDSSQFVSETEKGFQARGSGQTLFLDLDTAVLNLLDLRRSLTDKNFIGTAKVGLQESIKRQQAIQKTIGVLERQIPKETIEFFEKNEVAIRAAMKTNHEAVRAKEDYLGSKEKTKEPTNLDQIKENPSLDLKENSVDRLRRGINLVKGKEENKPLVAAVAADTFGNLYTQNSWITPDRILLAHGRMVRKLSTNQTNMQLDPTALWDMTIIAAGNIEDFYHRKIEPSLSEVRNRIRLTLGDLANNISDKDFNKAFEDGKKYFDANQADPFFSRLKQDAVEKLPNRMTAQQALNVLQGNNQNEFEWTVGLDKFLNDKKVEKFSKQELIDVIQKGQVRVEASVASEDIYEQRRLAAIEKYKQEHKNDKLPLTERLVNRIVGEKYDVYIPENLKPKYSLKAYTGEKLELPGAVNSKEVKLISVDSTISPKYHTLFEQFLKNINSSIEKYEVLPEGEKATIERDYRYNGGQYIYDQNYGKSKYQAPHWDEPNVVAHYRSNDRITTDNTSIHFSEEFQSDWNHDIRTLGLKMSADQHREFAESHIVDTWEGRELSGDSYQRFQVINDQGEMLSIGYTKKAAVDNYLINIQRSSRQVEPNPFMSHAWKELVFKRFLRDAVVAKDENIPYTATESTKTHSYLNGRIESERTYTVLDKNGDIGSRPEFKTLEEAQKYIDNNKLNNEHKYEGIGWTTARQQKERYGALLDGKDFKWRKNSNGDYTFEIKSSSLQHGYDTEGYITPHELRNISLERFAELTTKEAAEEVRDQEAKSAEQFWTQRDIRRLKTLRKDLEGVDIQSYVHRDLFAERDKLLEKEDSFKNNIPRATSGKFSLKEAVELRSGIGKYSDYDVAFVNYAKKIGKRFGANYFIKKVVTEPTETQRVKRIGYNVNSDGTYDLALYAIDGRKFQKYAMPLNEIKDLIGLKDSYRLENKESDDPTNTVAGREGYIDVGNIPIAMDAPKIEKVHFLEITPSMRLSLEKEGFPLYGLGSSEPLKSPEFGIRNTIVNTDAFNSARENLVDKLTKLQAEEDRKFGWMKLTPEERVKIDTEFAVDEQIDPKLKEIREKLESERKGTVFNSGLNPNAFIDQVKLLYKGYQDLTSFTKALVDRYGEPIRQFAEDLWFQVKGIASDFNDKFNIAIDKWQDNLNKVADDPAWQIRQGEKGRFSLRRKDKSLELEDYFTDPKKHQSIFDIRGMLRGVALSQVSTEFGKIYDALRLANRVVNSYESNVINQLLLAKKLHKVGLDQSVADAIYTGNESKKTYSDPELSARGLNQAQIEGYKSVRAAIDNVLNLRLETTLYGFRAKADALNNDLMAATPGTTEYIDIQTKLVDLDSKMKSVGKHFEELKNTGYISLQRTGKVAAYLDDPNYPVGDPKRKIYNQFDNEKQANDWLQKQKAALGIAASTKWGNIYDIRNLKDIVSKEKLTPSQFEDLVDRAGANVSDKEIEKLRTEVYSKFPSYTYQLHREFIRGYDADLQTAIESITKQLGLYSSSFYSKVGGEEGLKALEATGIEKSDPNLYKISSSYIKDETQGREISKLGQAAIKARRLTYFWQLGFDINQLWLNAVAQPITQTYPYFARISYEGKKLTGLEPEHYFLKAGKMTAKSLVGSSGDPIFDAIKQQLVNEHVLSPEFTRTLIEAKTKGLKKSPVETVEHWGSVFMREGEKVTRTHAAAEAYLVGSEKFGLSGDDLVKFMVKAVDATQSNPTRGENPYYIRSLGEGGKLVYQFMAFNQMWWENLGIGIKQTKGSQRAAFVGRELFPLMLMGGITGMPLYGFASTMYTLLTGRDPKEDLRKLTKQDKDSLLEQFALYGLTTSQGMSQKLTPNVPILDQAGRILTTDPTHTGLSQLVEQIPVFATADQITTGTASLFRKGKRIRAINALPRFLKGPAKFVVAQEKGIKTSSGDTIISRKKLTQVQKAGMVVNIQPTQVGEFYEKERVKKLKKVRRSLKRAIL